MKSSQQLVENLEKTYKKSEASDCFWKWETRHNTESSQCTENSRQPIANTQSGFQPLSHIIAERLNNIQINELNNYLRKETKKSVKRAQHKIKQINYLPVFKETVKVKKTNKKYSRVETLHSLGYSVKEIPQDSQVNISLSTVKRLKSKIKTHGDIMREEGSGRPEKLSEIHKNNILKLIADSPFNTSNRISI